MSFNGSTENPNSFRKFSNSFSPYPRDNVALDFEKKKKKEKLESSRIHERTNFVPLAPFKFPLSSDGCGPRLSIDSRHRPTTGFPSLENIPQGTLTRYLRSRGCVTRALVSLNSL